MIPQFAVVGHPNKGKSSIVSTIAQNDSVAISMRSGTTQQVERYEVAIDDKRYCLIDTPGFQRPSRALAWLQQHAPTAEKRQDAVRQFIASPDCRKEFPEEAMLLEPIMGGASILYVVDGSRPYGAEYEAEMEILRWTGQASMALINPIENDAHVDEWQSALGQYFKTVRVFNAVQADFDRLVALLETFAYIREDWRDTILGIVSAYRRARSKQQLDAANLLQELLLDLCTYQVSQVVASKAQALELKLVLEHKFLDELGRRERRYHDSLKSLYNYHHLESTIDQLPADEQLFDTEKWIIWGLNRMQLTAAVAMAGAAAGAAVDLAVAGGTFMLGALGGGLLAGGGAWMGADRIARFKLKGLPVGGFEARFGPIKNPNFPYVLMGRYLHLADSLRNRTHASRQRLEIKEGDLAARIQRLDKKQQTSLHRAMDKLSKQKSSDTLQDNLIALIAAGK